MPNEITRPILLLGEGIDEVRFFEAMLRYLKIENIQVDEFQGKSNLSRYIKLLVKRPNFRELSALAITRDADEDVGRAFLSVCGFLKDNGLSYPTENGSFIGVKPKIGVFIVSGGSKGMLEDMCLNTVGGSRELQCIDNMFDCVRDNVNRTPNNMSKARMRAWLSTFTECDKKLGEAALSGYFPWEHDAFSSLLTFVRTLNQI